MQCYKTIIIKCLFSLKLNDIPGSFVLRLPIGVIVVFDITVEVGVEVEESVRAVNNCKKTKYYIL